MADTPERPDPDVHVDAENLRGLAHPLRVRALNRLRRHGPATATQLAEKLGQTSGTLSYHLRQLEAYGFISEVPDRGNGRERWWQAAHRATRFDLDLARSMGADETTLTAGAEYLRSVARVYADRLERFTDGLEALTVEEPQWADAFTLSDWPLTVTPDQAKQVIGELSRLADRFRDEHSGEPSSGARAVTLQLQVFPSEPA